MTTNDEQVEKAARAWHEAACAAVPGWGAPWGDLAPVEREAAVGFMRAALAVVESEPGRVSAEQAWDEAAQATADAVWAVPGRPRWGWRLPPNPYRAVTDAPAGGERS